MIKNKPFAVWITGLPASGKSVYAKYLAKKLKSDNVKVQILESDSLRKILTPRPNYSEEERDIFYNTMIYIGKLLIKNGISVIFDATANKRKYRDKARREIKNYIEVYLKCLPKVCAQRDPKGLYKSALEGKITTLPGIQASYEEPLKPEVIIHSDRESIEEGVRKILSLLVENGL